MNSNDQREIGAGAKQGIFSSNEVEVPTADTSMVAMCLHEPRLDSLAMACVSKPQCGPREVLVKVHGTAVTPTELQWFPTFHTASGSPRTFPIILGHEFSGVVEKVGADVTGFSAGDPVYGINDWFSDGAEAEYCSVPAGHLAAMPRTLGHIDAAVVPISALTAWQGLFERCGLEEGQRVLIHGAAGGVGVFAVQLARWKGAVVFATASAVNIDFVRSLGAHHVIDYQAKRFEDVLPRMDVVFDAVGGETLDRSWTVLLASGRLVSVASSTEATPDPRNKAAFMLVRADSGQLNQISRLIDEGILRVFVAGILALENAKDAYLCAMRGKIRGKICLRVAAEPLAVENNNS